MNTETTEPITNTIGAQRHALQVLADLTEQHPTLPAPYIVIHRPYRGGPADLHLQLDTPSDFEQWRTALRVPADDVTLRFGGVSSWISAETTIDGVLVAFSGHGIALTAQQITAPRTIDETAPAVIA